ncbi:hypothetical protein SAMN05444397_108173 [Flavobacterium aquidurense]|uniref:hypothetical protein n=1 Tax=Flavobacterium frigidimaris TaxID=262320 RepID=UPI000896CF33|nr:hypothetical protein [Flavobacterium frigidimaris]SDZ53068.1 hypothetical protein SAMN05444397_108173 [Flavobacterium aquidurense]
MDKPKPMLQKAKKIILLYSLKKNRYMLPILIRNKIDKNLAVDDSGEVLLVFKMTSYVL